MGKVLARCCGPLVSETLRLLADRPRWMTYERIQADLKGQGSSPINAFWLSCFVTGAIKLPDVDRVELLYSYLAGKPLQF